MSDLLTTNDAAKVLGKAPATVIYYEKAGKLSSMRTAGGIRLFHRNEVENLADQLRTARAERTRGL